MGRFFPLFFFPFCLELDFFFSSVAVQLVIMSSKQAILISNADCNKLSYYVFGYRLSIDTVNG